jgi:acetylornithine deacetylase/succinyl-diaminopimelate desuccinylase-like protein
MFTHVKAIEAYLKSCGSLPINVKCLFEGEEETGSAHLLPFVTGHKGLLAADAAVMSDTPMLGPDRPAITHAMRGALSLELEVRGPDHDLHSGNFGGVVHNPLQALCEIVARLHEPDGRIAIRGIYDQVRRWPRRERALMAENGPSAARVLQAAGSERDWGEHGFTLYERLTLRPALTVNGITGGYQGVGGKAVIPARASAKLSFRLVPDQEPATVARLLRHHIASRTPPTVHASVRVVSASRPAIINPKHPAMRAAAFAYRKGFGRVPSLLRGGGTIPVLRTFQEALGIPTVLMGFALPDDRMHAPNEKFHLPNFFRGIATCIWFLAALGAQRDRNGVSRSSRPGAHVMAA